MKVVRMIGEDDAASTLTTAIAEARRIESSLLPASRKLLRELPVIGMEGGYLRFLEQRIHRNPRDLATHVRRLLLNHALQDRVGTNGALVDLFLVLGYRGRPLRRRLLHIVSDTLSDTQQRFFRDHLEDGLYADDTGSSVPRSCLSRQIKGSVRIVAEVGAREQPHRDPVSVARQALANGEEDVAKAILEGALDADPGSEEICVELLSLYKRQGLREDFLRTYTSMIGRRLARPDLWRALSARFSKQKHAAHEYV
ncbi:MAG: hypothetical protein QNJ07_03435 [Woeseiaceae bacterium]|nr:hypothetical protein [Woeseiaceae bacterium]